MEISSKLANEIYTIVLFHTVAVTLLVSFTSYLIIKAKKNALLSSYLLVVGSIILWMVAKIFKTISPNAEIRWIFIVLQYLGIEFLSYFILLFAILYRNGHLPQKKYLLILAFPSIIGFLVVLTNPLHMLFYSYYDFYKDSFGPVFFIVQSIQYIMFFSGVIMLGKGYTRQPSFHNKKNLAKLFAFFTIIPVSGNIYYLLVKLTPVPWVKLFPFFDFTPVTSSIALILFVIPAIRYRFFDISPIGYRQIFDTIPEGIALLHKHKIIYSPNKSLESMFPFMGLSNHIFAEEFVKSLPINEAFKEQLMIFFKKDITSEPFILSLDDNRHFKLYQYTYRTDCQMLLFKDITPQTRLLNRLKEQGEILSTTNQKLTSLADVSRNLVTTQTQTKIAQDVHDILGHSLTVVIGTLDLALLNKNDEDTKNKLMQTKNYLKSSLLDLYRSIDGKDLTGHTTLINSINSLKNDTVNLELTVQGHPYEINTTKTENVFRICQEAVTNSIKHGKSVNIDIIIRYKKEELEIFIFDDGIGCENIIKSQGLLGMENRVTAMSGNIVYGSAKDSDGGKGFHIHINIPMQH